MPVLMNHYRVGYPWPKFLDNYSAETRLAIRDAVTRKERFDVGCVRDWIVQECDGPRRERGDLWAPLLEIGE